MKRTFQQVIVNGNTAGFRCKHQSTTPKRRKVRVRNCRLKKQASRGLLGADALIYQQEYAVYYTPTDDYQMTAMVCSSFRKAVTRNRIRRVIKHVFWDAKNKWPSGLYVFQVRHSFAQVHQSNQFNTIVKSCQSLIPSSCSS